MRKGQLAQGYKVGNLTDEEFEPATIGLKSRDVDAMVTKCLKFQC